MTTCPHCHASLVGPAIPEEHLYNALDAKPGDPGWVTHGRREIGIEVSDVYDGVLFYECRDCSGRWHRFPDEPRFARLREAAERNMR